MRDVDIVMIAAKYEIRKMTDENRESRIEHRKYYQHLTGQERLSYVVKAVFDLLIGTRETRRILGAGNE